MILIEKYVHMSTVVWTEASPRMDIKIDQS